MPSFICLILIGFDRNLTFNVAGMCAWRIGKTTILKKQQPEVDHQSVTTLQFYHLFELVSAFS